jgi:hypothetical protein
LHEFDDDHRPEPLDDAARSFACRRQIAGAIGKNGDRYDRRQYR